MSLRLPRCIVTYTCIDAINKLFIVTGPSVTSLYKSKVILSGVCEVLYQTVSLFQSKLKLKTHRSMRHKRRSPLQSRADLGWSIFIFPPRVEPPEGSPHHQHSSKYHQGKDSTNRSLRCLRYHHSHLGQSLSPHCFTTLTPKSDLDCTLDSLLWYLFVFLSNFHFILFLQQLIVAMSLLFWKTAHNFVLFD